MIQKYQNDEVKQNVQKIIKRSSNIINTVKMMSDYILMTQQNYSSYSKQIFKDLEQFEGKISKASRYEPEKTNVILRLSKQYRQFPSKIQNLAQINMHKLISLSKMQQLNRYETQLIKKSQQFGSEFKNYNNTIYDYNQIYHIYNSHCKSLEQIITKFKSYSQPLKFYNKSITTQYQQKLQSVLNISKHQETKLKTELQLLDSKRKFLDQHIKDIREIFTMVFNHCLREIQALAILITDVKNYTHQDKNHDNSIGSMQHSKNSETYQIQFQRLNNFTANVGQGNQIMNDFKEIMKDKQKNKLNQFAISDYKLFNVRCDNLKKRKEQSFLQTLNLQQSLVNMFQLHMKKYKQFDKNFKEKQRGVFEILGKETYKKDYEHFFGKKTFLIHELCFQIIEMPKKSFQKINKWMSENINNFKQAIVIKKQAIFQFNKLYEQIMLQHLKHKQNYEQTQSLDSDIVHLYRTNIVQSLDNFREIFSTLEQKQLQKDKFFSQKLLQLHKTIHKQSNNCKVQNIVQSNKQKINVLKNFKVINQSMFIFKNDPIYTILYDQFFNFSLLKKFQSMINHKQYNQAEIILKQKQKIAKKMLKKQVGCCGLIKAKPIQTEIINTFKCYIHNQGKIDTIGALKILKEGMTFEQSMWNPFSQKIHILIPNSDIHSVESKTLTQGRFTQAVSIETQKGPIIFKSKHFEQLYASLQKHYGETYRKSMVFSKKGKNDSTQSTRNRASVIVSYNKDLKTFTQQPVCLNPALSKMNQSNSMERNFRGSGVANSIYQLNQQNKLGRSSFTPSIVNRSSLQQKQALKVLEGLLKHINKRQFLSEQFVYVNRQYKSTHRKDYQFKDVQTHNRFLLKQQKKSGLTEFSTGTLLEIRYEWKVSYPNNPSLHSFKHGQKIIIDLNMNPSTISIIQRPHYKDQIFNRHFFYQHIKNMNAKIWQYIVQNTNRNYVYQSTIEKEQDQNTDRDDLIYYFKNQAGDIKASRLERAYSQVNKNDILSNQNIQTTHNGESKNLFGKSSFVQSGSNLFKGFAEI